MPVLRTARLVLTPITWADAPALNRLKADPRVYGMMLGGVRSPVQAAEEFTADIAFWGAHGVGMWTIRDHAGSVLGLTGVHDRPDGRGLALRFALDAAHRGRGLAREAAGAALRDAHERGEVPRVIAVAREDNIGSRLVLGGIGMRQVETFPRGPLTMLLYESLRRGGPVGLPDRG